MSSERKKRREDEERDQRKKSLKKAKEGEVKKDGKEANHAPVSMRTYHKCGCRRSERGGDESSEEAKKREVKEEGKEENRTMHQSATETLAMRM